ncbi:VanW family protein [Planococcus donghaensis]|uniref:VanW family protein n=1 Tax=Planococcus donghaensis TaxID=414778 RepID=UPI003736AF8C
MDNKLFGLTFAAVFGLALFVFGATNAGAYAVDNWLFPTEEFGDNTYIGTTDVSNMEVASAKMLFAGQSETWRADAELHVTYQDATEQYPLENAQILLDETVGSAETGSQNGFVFQLSPDTTGAFLAEHFPVAAFSGADVEAINEKLETALQVGQTKTNVAISDDSLSLSREKVSDVVFPASFSSLNSSTVIDALDGIQLAPGTQFSFLEFIAELPLTDISDGELTQIASAIYGALLQTNFQIDERSIGSQVPASIPLGQEAAINRQLAIDFVFTNPNDSSFTLNLSKSSDSVNASISGYPFVYSYAIGITEETDIQPRLIKQYSAFVTSGNKVEETGLSGKRLNVIRTILEDDEPLEVETVSNDFYPPVHRVEVYPLTQPAAPEATVPVAGEPGFMDANGDGIHDGTTTTPVAGQPGFVDADGDGIHDGPTTPPTSGQPGFVDADGDGVHDGTTATPTVPTVGQPGFIDANGDGVHDGTVTPEVPTTGQPGFIDRDGDGEHDVPAPTAPAKDPDKADEKPVYDKGGKIVTE